MNSSDTPRPERNRVFDYLCVDDFIGSFTATQALKSAFELRLIDYLLQNQASTLEQIEKALGGDRRGWQFLLDLLRANQVVEISAKEIELTSRFLNALRYRDLLEAKILFCHHVAPDLLDHFSEMIVNPGQFMRQARLFNLFDYRRCLNITAENYERTRIWMRLTTSLSRHEARVCMHYHEFGSYRRMLDIGGNSGEFAVQLCKQHPCLVATVFDLPMVCEIGREHIQAEPEVSRISFTKGNALQDPLPIGFDLITFKSMLHDWPEAEAKRLITRASNSLNPGGTLLIFERGPIVTSPATFYYANTPMLPFFRSFRRQNSIRLTMPRS